MKYLPLIMTGVLLNAVAQLCLKLGMKGIGHFEFSTRELLGLMPKLALAPYIWGGLACYAVSVVVWCVVLSRVEMSFAYPMVSVGYIVALIFGWWLPQLHENVTPVRILGVVVIIVGVVLVSRTEGAAA
jgi:multidrug transporter EmrE-like cation transporter